MRLAAMASAWEEQNRSPKANDLGFDERFAMLVDAEYVARENRRLKRLLRDAEFRISEACMEGVKASAERGLPPAKVKQLATGKWIDEHLNVLITGATGVGKSFLACALGQLACRKGYKVAYRRLPRLFEEITFGEGGGNLQQAPRQAGEGRGGDPR
jgi:DNA replication protein DnaC